jgi:hypothetical protein
LPPTGPPPAFGASVFGFETAFASDAPAFVFAAGLLSVGVAATALPVFVFASLFRRGAAFDARSMGVSLTDYGAVFGWVTDGVALACPLVTSPIALSPGGAATILTRYIGGNATGFRSLRELNSSVATAA